MSDSWLVTGGAGFIGRAVVRLLLDDPSTSRVTVLDAMTYAAHVAALDGLDDGRLAVLTGDVAEPEQVDAAFAEARPDRVLHLAAESHVDRSLHDAAPFVRTNVTGSWNIAQAALRAGVRLVQVSTDEVYGDREGHPAVVEGAPVAPTNPYAATKACADAMVAALVRSHDLDAVITRGVNTFGPGQFPEKLLPLAARRWAGGASMPLYGDGLQTREWLYVDDHAAGIIAAARRGQRGAVLHLAGEGRTNLEALADWHAALGHDGEPPLESVADRPGHDRLYALDDRATRSALGWAPATGWIEGLARTARWRDATPHFWDERMADPRVAAWFRSCYDKR
jgi:dTDP-glucose 4,6-dehydratase